MVCNIQKNKSLMPFDISIIMPPNKCKIEFKEHGLEISGGCAQGFLNAFDNIYRASSEVGREISAYACVNPKKGTVERVILGEVGSPTGTSLPFERVCPIDHRQVSIHSHPVSGEAKFSQIDALTITDRMNREVDDGSCVVGEDATQCLFRTLISKGRDSSI